MKENKLALFTHSLILYLLFLASSIIVLSSMDFEINIAWHIKYILVATAFSILTVYFTSQPIIQDSLSDNKKKKILLVSIFLTIYLFYFAASSYNELLPSIWLLTYLEKFFANLKFSIGEYNYDLRNAFVMAWPVVLIYFVGLPLKNMFIAKGKEVGKVLLIWSPIFLAYLIYDFYYDLLTVKDFFLLLLANFLANGPFEELFYRGLVFGSLLLFLPVRWSLVLQALLFGLFHYWVQQEFYPLASSIELIANTIIRQGLLGYFFGVVTWRTKSIIPSTILHILVNTLFF